MAAGPLVLPPEGIGLPVIVSASGGKDSTAMLLALREAGIEFRAVFADTGWEADETYAYLDLLRNKICPIDVVGAPGGMEAKIKQRAGFPARLQRWCTRELKLDPLRKYHDSIGTDTISAVGVRADESEARSKMPVWIDDQEWGGYVWRPMLTWHVEDIIKLHYKHGIPINPLYHRGHDRVGCYPCIFSRKEEIKLISIHAPERINKIRQLEQEATAQRKLRNAENPGRYKLEQATFFQSVARPKINDIDDVVAWSKTKHGGKEVPMLAPLIEGGCMRWGVCETPKEPK